jgi:heterodisulfide reductase subunit A
VEKEGELGGLVRNLHNLYLEGGDPMKVLKPLIDRTLGHPNIKHYLGSRVSAVDGYVGNFVATITPVGRKESVKAKVGTIIVATGALDLMPEGLFGYDQYDNVVNLTEFEILCKKRELPKIQSIAFIQCAGGRGLVVPYCSRICCTVALKNAINVIDNYNEMLGKTEVAGKAQVVEKIHVEEKASEDIMDRRRRRRRMDAEKEEEAPAAPASAGIDVTVFNRTIVTYGVEHELYFNKAREKRIRFIRYIPEHLPKVSQEGDRLSVTYWHETLKAERKLTVDMVVLSTPLIAQPDAKELSQMLKVPLGQDKFYLEAHVKLRPVDFATDGIYVCGTARGPGDITECVHQALAAASRATIPMTNGYVQAEALTSMVDDALCTGCRTCEFTCPYAAISVDPATQKAHVTEVMCKGCGTCAASCPKSAISMRYYTTGQLEAQIHAITECKEGS